MSNDYTLTLPEGYSMTIPQAPVEPPSTEPKVIQPSKMLDLIGKGESKGGNYNIAWGGKEYALTDMTVDQALALQRKIIKGGGKSSALGKYQIINKTLKSVKNDLDLDGTEKFNEEMQDKMAIHLLKKRGLDDFMEGKLDRNTFVTNIAKEWASFPKDVDGKSYYAGDGLNAAHIKHEEVLEALEEVAPPIRKPEQRPEQRKPEKKPLDISE